MSRDSASTPANRLRASIGRWRLLRVAGGVLIALAGVRLLGVNIIPTITNDSVEYLELSQTLLSDGLVWNGFRQTGYPAFLATVEVLGSIAGIEPVLLAAVLQRLALGAAVSYGVWVLRWWSIPIVLVVTAPDLVGYTNFILVEGVSVALALGLGLVLVHLALLVLEPEVIGLAHLTGRENREPLRATQRSLAVVAAVGIALLVLMRFQAIVFAAPLMALLWAMRRLPDHRRFALLLGGLFLAFLGTVTLTMSLENQAEHDDFFPLSRGVRNAYWGAHQLVFYGTPSNATVPELVGYYNDGDPYGFMDEVEAEYATYAEQRAVYEEAIAGMLTAGGYNKRREQVVSMVNAARGGRIDDVAWIIERMRWTSDEDAIETIHSNTPAGEVGVPQYHAGFNGGEEIKPIMTGRYFPSFPGLSARGLLGVFGPEMMLFLLIAALANARVRLLALATFTSGLAVFAFSGMLLIDNHRYVITTLVFLTPLGFLALNVIVRRVLDMAREREHAQTANS